MYAIKCLYQALKSDKDLIRLFSKIEDIKENSEIEDENNIKEFYDATTMNDNHKNNFANTYLNISAILSLMKNHDKALHMVQKAIEMITQEKRNKYFSIDNFLNDLIGDDKNLSNSNKKPLLITLTAAYYNKTIELEYLNSDQNPSKEYLSIANDSIDWAMKWLKLLPNSTNSALANDIQKLNDKLKFMQSGLICFSNRGSSRRLNKRVLSPQIYNQIKDINMEDLQKFGVVSPKSFSGRRKVIFHENSWKQDTTFSSFKNATTQVDNNLSPQYKRRLNNDLLKETQTELQINYSPFGSDGEIENDNNSGNFSNNSSQTK